MFIDWLCRNRQGFLIPDGEEENQAHNYNQQEVPEQIPRNPIPLFRFPFFLSLGDQIRKYLLALHFAPFFLPGSGRCSIFTKIRAGEL